MTQAADAAIQFAATLGLKFNDLALLARAFTHRSLSPQHNERLEFLGDAVLNCAMADVLYHQNPSYKEGDLSRYRSHLVCQASLANAALRIGLSAYLRLGAGEIRNGGAQRPSILADALEALIGAVYVDAGYDAARGLVLRLFKTELHALPQGTRATVVRDPKTGLQEWLQARRIPLPSYEVLAVTGEAHAQHFVVCCRVQGYDDAWQGEGSSRRAAEQAAAQSALRTLQPNSVL